MYIPIHVLPILIFKRKRLALEPLQVLKQGIKNVIKSCLFVSIYIMLWWYFMCKFRVWRKKSDVVNVIGAGTISSVAIFLEPQGRRKEITLFLIPRFLEQLWNSAEKRGHIKSMNNANIWIWSFALSVIMYNYQCEQDNIKGSYLSLLQKFFGENWQEYLRHWI